MNSRAKARLVVVNIVLLALALGLALSPGARGQPAADRRTGTYTMVSGRVQGSTTNTIYIIDSVNQELVALSWDRGRNQLAPIGYRNLVTDAKAYRGTR